jgi:S-adenosylmethionine decarboxylase proenzyme
MHSLSPTSACLYAALASCAAFIAGRATSIYYIGSSATTSSTSTRTASGAAGGFIVQPSQQRDANTVNSIMFPTPELIKGKEAPKTKYTSMVSSNVLSYTADYATLHLDTAESSLNDSEEVCIQTDDGHRKCSIDGFNEEDYEAIFQQTEEANAKNANASNDEEVEEHLPAGQHLLIDIERVNSEFLNDEVSLAKAMVDVIHEIKLTLLSYHCHKLIPMGMGVSCVGVLLESHISFHTWPEAGVIILDLFTCGDGELVPVLPSIKRLFAIPRDGARSDTINEQPRIVWNHKLWGFRNDYAKTDLMDIVLEASDYDLKEEIASVQTPFQHIDVHDVIDQKSGKYNGYEKSLLGNDTYETRNPLLFSPNRIVFLDEVMQSQRFGNEAYHETLVHPAMFLHLDPKRVAIIGGGEGATLREVLKHNTVDKVKMIEIDEVMVQVSREFLPDWNNCTDLVGSAEWCGDDERADIHYVDAFGWFNDRFATGVEEKIEEQFDVLIMDAL